MDTTLPPRNLNRLLFRVFFWLFNISLLLLLLFGFFPQFGIEIIRDALLGEVPFSILLPAIGLVGVPTTSTVLSLQAHSKAKAKPQQRPLTLTQIFYGIEAPLLMGCTIRLFFLRDLTHANSFIFGSITLGTIAFVHWLLTTRNPEQETEHWLHLTGLTVLLVLSFYFAAITLFFIPPLLYGTLMALPVVLAIVLFSIIFFPMGILLYGWASMPFGMILIFQSVWKQSFARIQQQYGKNWARAGVIAIISIWLGTLLLLQQQPQKEAFQLLENPPQTDNERKALVQQSETIRQGLLNAYLNSYRYPALENRTIYQLYRVALGETGAEGLQWIYDRLLAPFAYQGDFTDKDKAASLYAKFFDTPILRGEHQAIQKAVLSNFNRAEASAGLIDINAERVQLEQQSVTVMPNGDWADIELHEVYANQTFENTEIFYYFSLPESASITGLWLGETDDLNQRYEYAVSPRGAAQQVYKNQVRRAVDPALLEQVGPRNYRLRAFPIPPVQQDSLPEDGQPDKMHLWMTYRVMKQNNQWPLPTLHEQRNIFWTPDTHRMINGQPQESSEDWLPQFIPADDAPLQSHQGQLPGGYIIAKPLAETDYQLPKNQHIAVVLDSSYSMRSQKDHLRTSLQWLKDEIVPHNTVNLFVTHADGTAAEQVSDIATFNSDDTVFYGWQQPDQMLRQFKAGAIDQNYDAIVMLTDSGSYELTEDGEPVSLDTPLWLVHLGGMQAAYNDATLEAIQRTGGSVGDNFQAVMQRMATQPSLGEGTSLLNVADGYAWYLRESADTSQSIEPELTPLAARQWITQLSQSVKPTDLKQLDAIHTVAKDNSIVTPYSSMIVLVNDDQRRQLKEAENNSDRFQREAEDQQLPDAQSSLPNVSAVPEPGEWLLLLLTLCLVSGVYTFNRGKHTSILNKSLTQAKNS